MTYASVHTRTTRPLVVMCAMLAAIGCGLPQAMAQDHPQEVLDLISAYQALSMKVRPLQDRIVVSQSSDTGFRPEGAPLRARAATSTTGSTGGEQRVPETLRHRDRSASAADADAIRRRLSALDREIQAQIERISVAGVAGSGTRGDNESGGIGFGDGIRGTRPPPAAEPQPARPARANRADAAAIADARRRLNQLEQEYAAVEREVAALSNE